MTAATVKDEKSDRSLDGRLIAAAVNEVMVPFGARDEKLDLGINVVTAGLLMSCCPELCMFPFFEKLMRVLFLKQLFDLSFANLPLCS